MLSRGGVGLWCLLKLCNKFYVHPDTINWSTIEKTLDTAVWLVLEIPFQTPFRGGDFYAVAFALVIRKDKWDLIGWFRIQFLFGHNLSIFIWYGDWNLVQVLVEGCCEYALIYRYSNGIGWNDAIFPF